MATAADLQYRQPPPGLRRRERADWQRAEGQRLAELHAPAKGLPRKAHRTWTAVHREQQAAKRQQEYSARTGERSVGALVVVSVLACLLVWRVFFTGEEMPQQQQIVSAPDVTYSAAPATTADAASNRTAAGAVEAWFTSVCGSSPDDPQTSRLARAKSLMTPEGWAALDHSAPAPAATFTCGPVTAESSIVKPGTAAVLYTAQRFVSGSPTVITIQETRTAVQQPDGTWLVGPLLADH